MLSAIFKAIFGTKSQRDVKKMLPVVARINAIEEDLQKLSDEELKAKTGEFRDRLARGETLDDIMCEAFAVVKNACRRLVGTEFEVCGQPVTWNMVPFDVQLMGGIALHKGNIAEMATGEGKTLVATLPLYLNALTGKNCQLVTVNDYLALRDSSWMGLLFNYLGISVGCLQNMQPPDVRRQQYACDITYGTNSDEKAMAKAEVEVAIQICGKVKMKLMVPSEYGKEETEKFALDNADVQALIGGKPVRKIIAVPGRIVNIVV